MASRSLASAHLGTLCLSLALLTACAEDGGTDDLDFPDGSLQGTPDAAAGYDAGGWQLDGALPGYDAGGYADAAPLDDAGAQGDASSVGDAASDTDSGSTQPPATCTGKAGKTRNKSRQTVMVGSMMRSFVYYAPASLDANKAAPLVISPHGFTMSGEDMYTLTGFKELADKEGFVAVFPDGGGASPWNVGTGISGVGGAVAASHDDQGFIDAMIKFTEADQCLDKSHIFVSGFSMGGYFSNENACLRSDIAGIGPHSGGSHDLTACKGSIKPVIIFHGDTDPLITYDNGTLARDRWVKRNGCTMESEKKMVKGGSCDYYKGCPAKAQVALCTFSGMGHAWAGGKGNALVDSSKENAAELAWAFWKQYAW